MTSVLRFITFAGVVVVFLLLTIEATLLVERILIFIGMVVFFALDRLGDTAERYAEATEDVADAIREPRTVTSHGTLSWAQGQTLPAQEQVAQQ